MPVAMAQHNLKQFVVVFLFVYIWEESLGIPLQKAEPDLVKTSSRSFRGFIPLMSIGQRHRRAEGGQSNGGVGEFLSNAVQGGIASTSAFTSPTMFLGGFSMMMQPMPNGTEFAGNLMEMIPNFMSLLPSLPGRSEKQETAEKN